MIVDKVVVFSKVTIAMPVNCTIRKWIGLLPKNHIMLEVTRSKTLCLVLVGSRNRFVNAF